MELDTSTDADAGATTELLQRYCKREPGATSELVGRVQERLKARASSILKSHPDGVDGSVDLFDRGFMKVWQRDSKPGAPREYHSVGHYLNTIGQAMRQELTDQYKQDNADRRTPDRPTDGDVATACCRDSCRVLEVIKAIECIAVAPLDSDKVLAFVLTCRLLNNWSFESLSEMLECSVSIAKELYDLGRSRLRELLPDDETR